MNDSSKIKCRICDHEMSMITNTHLRSHKITTKEYKDRFPGVEMVSNHIKSKIRIGVSKPSVARDIYFKKLKTEKELRRAIRNHKRQEFLDSVDTLSCKICNQRSHHSLQGHITTAHSLTMQQYYEQTNSNSDDVYSQETRDKLVLIGDKNYWFNHEGKLSPFSEKFIKYQDEIDPKKIAYEKNLAAIKAREDAGNNSCTVGYYLKKGLTDDEAKESLKKRQQTFSLQKCIDKLGKVNGLKRWQNRQVLWHKSYKKSNYSKISQELFHKIKIILGEECIYAECKETEEKKNFEHIFKTSLGSVYKLDFYVPHRNRIIEFDGDYWHGKHLTRFANISRVVNRDEEILQTDPSLRILHIREAEYNLNKNETVQQCLEFLKS